MRGATPPSTTLACAPAVTLSLPPSASWLGRAAQAAQPTQGARRPRPTPHPAPSHAAARTQRPPCPPAPTPRAPGTQRAAFSRPCPLARPRPQVCDQQRRGQTATRRGVARPPPPSGGARCGARSPSARPAARGARVVLESRAWPAGGGRRCAYVTFISLYNISRLSRSVRVSGSFDLALHPREYFCGARARTRPPGTPRSPTSASVDATTGTLGRHTHSGGDGMCVR